MNTERPESTPSPRRRSAWPWFLAAVAVLLIATPIVLFFTMASQASSQMEEEQARIRASGEPATPADLEAFYARPPADQDVTQLWLAGCTPLESPAFMAAAGGLPIVGNGEGEIPPPGQPWPQLEAAERLLTQYRTSLDQLHQAAETGGAARYPTTFSAGFSMLLSHVQSLRGGARLLALEAQVRAHRGDAAGAARSIRSMFRLAGSLEQEPVLISQLVRIACDSLAQQQLQQLLPVAGFSDEDLAQLQAVVRGVRYAPGIERAMLGERVLGGQAFLEPATMMNDQPSVLWRLTRQADYTRYQQVMGDMIVASRQPWPLARQQVKRIEQDLALSQASFLTRWQHAVTAMAVPSVAVTIDAAVRGDTRNASADAAIAIELFRRREERLPDRLEQLVPSFLPQAPLDPFDGRPLRFVPGEREYVIYSVGADLQDNGGTDDGRSKPDISFRVLLPAGKEEADDEGE